jgi:hypothetical protein
LADQTLKADHNTLLSRQWATDLFASFSALKSAVWERYGARLKECFGDETAKLYAEAFESARALVDASGRDDSGALRMRFHCPAWMAQQFKSRALFPKSAGEEERKRLRARLARQWGRSGWHPLHLIQCATGLPLFRRDVKLFDANREREAAVYENEFTDLLLDVRRRARASRRKHTVWRFEQAAREALRAYVEREGFQVYAPDWRPEPNVAPRPVAEETADMDAPTVRVEALALRSATRAARIARELPAEEADACALLFFERIAETWEAETGRVFPLSPPVLRRADSKEKDEGSVERSHASPLDEVGDFPGKSDETAVAPQDNLSAVAGLEYEPEPEPRGVSLADAEAAAHACISVGVEAVKVVFIDDTKERGAPGSCTLAEDVTPAELLQRLPDYLERNRRTPVESFTVRLRRKEDVHLIQLDDCPPEVVAVLAPLAFLIHATSPGNAQAWLALAEDLTRDDYEELRYRLLNGPLKVTGANGGAYGSTRWPGSLNRKPKRRYADGESPRVQLLRINAGRRVTSAELGAAGLLAPPRPKPSESEVRKMRARLADPNDWPDMDHYLSACDGDRSRAESKWCVRALSMGHSTADVEAELERIGRKASVRRRDNYIRETVAAAARFVGLNPPRRSAQEQRHALAAPVSREKGVL